MLNALLEKLDIRHPIVNPFAFSTKREMVNQFVNCPGFIDNAHKTISCSHPCNGRWEGRTAPENCGYCYPCLIRQSSLVGLTIPNERYGNNPLSIQYLLNATTAKKSDFVDLLSSVTTAKHSTDEELLRRIKATGKLSQEEVYAFLRLYKATIDDIVELISSDPELIRIVGLAHETN